jgi:hypothetical protein
LEGEESLFAKTGIFKSHVQGLYCNKYEMKEKKLDSGKDPVVNKRENLTVVNGRGLGCAQGKQHARLCALLRCRRARAVSSA